MTCALYAALCDLAAARDERNAVLCHCAAFDRGDLGELAADDLLLVLVKQGRATEAGARLIDLYTQRAADRAAWGEA